MMSFFTRLVSRIWLDIQYFPQSHKRFESLEVRRNHVMEHGIVIPFDLSPHCVCRFFSTIFFKDLMWGSNVSSLYTSMEHPAWDLVLTIKIDLEQLIKNLKNIYLRFHESDCKKKYRNK